MSTSSKNEPQSPTATDQPENAPSTTTTPNSCSKTNQSDVGCDGLLDHGSGGGRTPRDLEEHERQRTLEVMELSASILDLTESGEQFEEAADADTPAKSSVSLVLPAVAERADLSQEEKTEETSDPPDLVQEKEDNGAPRPEKEQSFKSSTSAAASSKTSLKKQQYASAGADSTDYSTATEQSAHDDNRTVKVVRKSSAVSTTSTGPLSRFSSASSQHSRPGVVYAGGSSSARRQLSDGGAAPNDNEDSAEDVDFRRRRMVVAVDDATVASSLTPATSQVLSSSAAVPAPSALAETVTAYAVSRDDLEEEIRRRILAEAVEAHVRRRSSIVKGKELAALQSPNPKWRCYWFAGFALLVFVLVAVVVGVVLGTRPASTVYDRNNTGNETVLQDPYGVVDWTDQQFYTFLRLYMGDKGAGFDNPTGMSPTISAYQKIVNDRARRKMPLDDHMLDYFCLTTIYFSSGGDSGEWLNNTGWDDQATANVCDRFGVVCDSDGYVIGLVWPNNNMLGKVTPEYSTFAKRLKYLDFSGNIFKFTDFDGMVMKFSHLELLNVSHCDIGPQGFDEPDFGNRLPALRLFDISGNAFSGRFPSSFANLTSLEYFMVQDNAMTGPVPSDAVAQWPSIQAVRLDNNSFTGTVPPSLCERRPVNAATKPTLNASLVLLSVDCADVSCDCCECGR